MKLTRRQQRVVDDLLAADTRSFVEFVRIAGLDPAHAFRGANLRDVDFGQDDLGGFDFTSADLRGADFRCARNLDRTVVFNAITDSSTLGFEPIRQTPENILGEAHALILAGQAPPMEWRSLLTELDFHDTDLCDLTPMSGLTQLQRLNLSDTKIHNIEPLSNMTSIHALSIENTHVSDLSPLSGMTALIHLDISGTDVTDLSPIGNIASLASLHMRNTRLRSTAKLAHRPQLRIYAGGGALRAGARVPPYRTVPLELPPSGSPRLRGEPEGG